MPITVTEQVRATQEAFEAGATIVHCHVRNDDETPTSDPEKFARLLEGLRKHCPGMIVQFSTGGRSGAGTRAGRHAAAAARHGLADRWARTISRPGSMRTRPDLVDWLAGEMQLYGDQAGDRGLRSQPYPPGGRDDRDGRLPGPLYVQFVMGVKNAMPVDREVFDFYVQHAEAAGSRCRMVRAPESAQHQVTLNEWCVANGGHARTGLEDNVRLDRDTLAPSNAALVRRVVALCGRHDRPVATPAEARAMLSLPAAT